MLACAAMAYTAVDEGKTMLACAAMAHVGVPVVAYTDVTHASDAGDNVCGDCVRGRTGDGMHRYHVCK